MEWYIGLLIFVWLIIIIQSYLGNINIKIGNTNVSIIAVILLIVFVGFYGLRDNIGYDYSMYAATVYGGYADEVYASKGEILSAMLLNIAGYFYNEHVFFFLVALIALSLIIYSIIKYTNISDGIGWSMLCFLAIPIGFINSMSIQRQFLAIAVLLFATRYLLHRNFVKYFMCVIIACLFHISSIIYILLYFITSSKFKYKYFLVLFIIGYIFIISTIKAIINIFPFYEVYVTSFNGFDNGGMTQITLYILFAIIFIYLKKYLKKYYQYDIYLKIYLGGLVLTLWLILFDANIAFRLGGVALLNMILLFPYIFYAFKNVNRLLVKLLSLVLLSIIYIYGLLVTDATFYLPYKTFL